MKFATHTKVPPRQLRRAKTMRANMTNAERKLWRGLRDRLAIHSTHFRRQVPIAGFIADFCCHAARLVIEVDGNQHGTDEAKVFDAARTASIKAEGYSALRFSNRDVLTALDAVLDTIAAALPADMATNPPPHGREEEHPAHG